MYFPFVLILHYWEDDKLKRSEEGFVEIWVEGSEVPLKLSFRDGDPEFHSNVPSPRTYLLAYGPTRLLPEPDQDPYESTGKVRVRNLFRPSTPLVDAREWLFSLHEATPESLGMRVRFKKETTAITNLSDGYRSVIALASDLMSMLSREGASMVEAEGVVLIDEIDNNLHPGWKKRIVGCFRDVFPRVQFISTTHEPLRLRGLQQGETILLRRDFEENIVPIISKARSRWTGIA